MKPKWRAGYHDAVKLLTEMEDEHQAVVMRVAELEAELAEAEVNYHEMQSNYRLDLDCLSAERQENKRLREALIKYGRHKNDEEHFCQALTAGWEPCTCGWEDALALKEDKA